MKKMKWGNRIFSIFLALLLTFTTLYSPQILETFFADESAGMDGETVSASLKVEESPLLQSYVEEDEESVTDYVRESVSTQDAMPAIQNKFGGYRLGDIQTLDKDGHIGIPVELSVYYKSSKNVQSGPNGTPIILYVINTPTVRTGTQTDETIIGSMLDRDYVVVVLDYNFNEKAVSPALDWSTQAVRNKLINGEFFTNLNKFTAGGTYYETFIVPAGHDVSLNHVYWEFDKHGADGTFENIVDVWNTDFRKDKGETLIKWTDASGKKKAVQNDFDGNTPSWCNADGTVNTNGQYIKIKFTKAQTITDCVKKDGSPIDLNLYMHIIYPTNPKQAVPVMALNSSSEHLAKGAATLDRPQVAGFAFNGYASVMFDFGYTPMARDDHYGLFQPVVTGDGLSYAVHFYSDKLIGTAAMRYIRYLSFTQSKFNFDTNAIGVYGNSKGGWVTYLGEDHPELLNAERLFKGHHGETRYDNNKRTDEGVIDGGEVQPWLTYNGATIDSGADFVYASCGGLEENITYGHAPTYVSCNIDDAYNSYYTSSNGFVNMCRIYDVPCLWFEIHKGHTLASGRDIHYNIDTYPTLFDFANFYLKKMPVKLLYTDITNGEEDVALDKELFFIFSGGVSRNQIEKLTPTTSTGEKAEGEWISSYGGTHWTFSPKLLTSDEVYTVSIPKSFYGTNKVRIEQAKSFSFTTKYARVDENQFITTSNGTYVWFNVGDSQEHILRAYISEDATNRLQLYKLTDFTPENPDAATVGEMLQEKVVYKSGNVEFDITDYCETLLQGTNVAFLLKQSKTAGEIQGTNVNFDNGSPFAIAGKITAEVADAPGGGKALMFAEMQPNTQYTSMEEFYNNITTIATKYTAVKAGTDNKLTAADVGRRYRLSFRVYDTYSRTMQVYIQSPTSQADGICDYNWAVKNFYTKANEWMDVEFEYTIYEPALYPERDSGVPNMIIKASAMGNITSPFYIDDFKSNEIINDVSIESVSVEGAEAWDVTESETLAKNVLEEAVKKEHPYILYETSDIATLKTRIESGYSAKAYPYVEKQAKNYLNATIKVYYNSSSDKSNGIIGRQLQSYVSYLNTYSILTDDISYKKAAVNLVITAVNQGSVDIYDKINGALCVSDFGYAYALAYDWLYNDMTAAERSLLKAEMEEIGTYLYTSSSALGTWGADTENRKAWNWNAVTHGALGMISVSLKDHKEWLTLAIERMKGYYSYAVDSTGAAMEGLHYIGYAMNTLCALDSVIYDATGVELLDYYPAMQLLPQWSMYMTTPYGNEQAAVGQGTKLDNYAPIFYIINRYSQTTELWGFEQTYNLGGSNNFTSDYAGNGWNAPGIIFYENKVLTPKAPTSSTALIKTYTKGLVSVRDGWTTDSSFATFTCGYGYSGCWNHPDDNSFTFFAKGESFVVDLGAGKLTSAHHNVVQVDGDGMYYHGGSSMIPGSMTANKELSNGALYLRGDNSDSYRDTVLTQSIRQFVYKGGNVSYVLAFDYAKGDTNNHTYTTNFYTDYDATVTVDSSNQAKALITGGNKGNKAYAFVYSPSGASFAYTENTTEKTKALTTSVSAIQNLQATLFITENADGSAPTVAWTQNTDGTVTATITYLQDGRKARDTYIFSTTELISSKTENCLHEIAEEIVRNSCIKTAATCSSPAVYYKSCYCGAKTFSSTFKYGASLGHSYSSYIYNNDATCEKDGTETARCEYDNCNQIRVRTLENSRLGHLYEEPYDCRERTCLRPQCGYEAKATGHVWENGVCRCGEIQETENPSRPPEMDAGGFEENNPNNGESNTGGVTSGCGSSIFSMEIAVVGLLALFTTCKKREKKRRFYDEK